MKTIKLWDGIRVTTANFSVVCENNDELWETLNMQGAAYDELKTEIMRELFCVGKCDLTPQYHGHMVILTVVINEEEEK